MQLSKTPPPDAPRLICASGTRCVFRPSSSSTSPSSTPREPARERRLAVDRLASSPPSPAGRRTAGNPPRAAAADRAPATTPPACTCCAERRSPEISSSTSRSALRSWLTRWQSSMPTLSSDVSGTPRSGRSIDHPQHHADRLAPQLHVEDLQPVAPRATRSAAARTPANCSALLRTASRRKTRPLNTKSGHRPTRVPLLEAATHQYNTRTGRAAAADVASGGGASASARRGAATQVVAARADDPGATRSPGR